MHAIAARPALQISISAFVEAAARNAHAHGLDTDHAAMVEQIRVFEFEDEVLEDHFEMDEDLPPLHEGWRQPVGFIAQAVYELVTSFDEVTLSSPAELAAALASAGHGAVLRRGLGAHDLTKAARTLRCESVVLYRYGDTLLEDELIIEPHFRARFELLADASPTYQSMLALLPHVFVGRLQQLAGLVQLAAAYLAHEYRRLGRAVPPWRTASALLSRWAPEHSQDVTPIASPPVSEGGGTCDRSSSFTSCDINGMSPVDSPTSVLLYRHNSVPPAAAAQAVQPVYGFAAPAAAAVVEQQPKKGAKLAVVGVEAKGASRKQVQFALGDAMPRILSARLTPLWFAQ